MTSVNFLMLSGSPRGKVSTSYNLLNYLKLLLERKEKSTEIVMSQKIVRSETEFDNFLTLLDNSDCFILATPLYVDSLPSHVIDIFEQISKRRSNGCKNSKPKFIAMVNNGFPEQHQNHLALQICQQFTEEANLEWFGGIPIGGGAILAGSSLEEAGGRGRFARAALEILAEALSKDEAVPEECIVTINKRVIPKRLYLTMAHSGWKKMSESNQVRDRIKDRPYLV